MAIARRIGLALLVSTFALTVLAGCSTPTSESARNASSASVHASRVRFYSSLKDMKADSAVVVQGVVTSQRVTRDIDPDTVFTVSTLTIQNAVKGKANLKRSTVEIRQFGATKEDGPATMLQNGSAYILYLTRSGLPGPQADQYYVTGGSAGMYGAGIALASQSKSQATKFSQVERDNGDNLPLTVDLAQAAN